ncbi:MAG TPA: hypothetical protein VF581_03180, partial [Flavobacterium sp.]
LYAKKKKVFVILKDVSYIGYDALIVLLSILIRFKASKIDFNGDFPTNIIVRKILLDSGFFDYFKSTFEEQDRYELSKKRSLSTHAWKLVDSELTSELIEEASMTIWSEKRRCQGVQRSLIELMQNTNNHADIFKEGEKHWFLSVQHRKKENIVSFSFVDFGIGVFESLNNKTSESKWYKWQNKLFSLFTINNNKELLKLILNGSLHKTVTGKYYRGKGLPGIYDAFNRKQINKLHIITNDVFADVENNNFLSLSNFFSGTFVYWEVVRNNINLEWIE